jgi:hypothetical protein
VGQTQDPRAKNQNQFVTITFFFNQLRWDELRILGPEDVPNEEVYIPIETEFVENLWVPDMYLWYLSELEVIDFLIPFSGLYFIIRKKPNLVIKNTVVKNSHFLGQKFRFKI